jgi:hypothetical protein
VCTHDRRTIACVWNGDDEAKLTLMAIVTDWLVERCNEILRQQLDLGTVGDDFAAHFVNAFVSNETSSTTITFEVQGEQVDPQITWEPVIVSAIGRHLHGYDN